MSGHIDTAQASDRWRKCVVDLEKKRVLLSRLTGSGQEKDLTEPPNCNGFGRIRHFNLKTSIGWPVNQLPIYPACNSLGITMQEAMKAQVFQLAACMWRCWYCFVPYDLLAALPENSEWFSVQQILDLFEALGSMPSIIDLSGGSPDLAPEWILWMMEELQARNLSSKVYLWSDDNLSTEYLFDKLTKHQLDWLATYPHYGRVCCFKGIDTDSFAFNTGASAADFERQFEIMGRYMGTSIDLYGYVTLTTPDADRLQERISGFIDRLQSLHKNFPLRVVPLEIRAFSPTEQRMKGAHKDAILNQEHSIGIWNSEIEKRFPGKKERVIHEVRIR